MQALVARLSRVDSIESGQVLQKAVYEVNRKNMLAAYWKHSQDIASKVATVFREIIENYSRTFWKT